MTWSAITVCSPGADWFRWLPRYLAPHARTFWVTFKCCNSSHPKNQYLFSLISTGGKPSMFGSVPCVLWLFKHVSCWSQYVSQHVVFNKFARFPGYTLYQEISLNYSWLLPICQEHSDKAWFKMIPDRGIQINFSKNGRLWCLGQGTSCYKPFLKGAKWVLFDWCYVGAGRSDAWMPFSPWRWWN